MRLCDVVLWLSEEWRYQIVKLSTHLAQVQAAALVHGVDHAAGGADDEVAAAAQRKHLCVCVCVCVFGAHATLREPFREAAGATER